MEMHINPEKDNNQTVREILCNTFELMTRERHNQYVQGLEQENGRLQKEIGKANAANPIVETLAPLSMVEVIKMALDRWDMMTVQEMCKKIDAVEERIRSALYRLQKEKVVSASSTTPKKYFLLSKGNTDLAECFPKGTKVEVMR